MYSEKDFKEKMLQILQNNDVSEWSEYESSIAYYASQNRIVELNPGQVIDALLEGGLEDWDNYELSMNEYDQYVDYLADDLKLTNLDNYLDNHKLGSALDTSLPNEMVNFDVEHVMATTDLSLIATEIKKLFPHENDFQIAYRANDFNKNADFYTPKTELGMQMLDKTKQIAGNIYGNNYKLSLDEYLLVAQPLFLAQSIQSGYLNSMIKAFFKV